MQQDESSFQASDKGHQGGHRNLSLGYLMHEKFIQLRLEHLQMLCAGEQVSDARAAANASL